MGAIACGSLVKLPGHWVTSCWPDTPTGVTLQGHLCPTGGQMPLGCLALNLPSGGRPFLASTTDMLF